MKYIHNKTQAVIETDCKIKGIHWVLIEESKKKTKKPKPKKSGDK